MESDELPLANQSDVKLLIIKNSSELKVHTDRYEAYVNDKRFSLKEALFHLVKVHGLREKVAKDLLMNKGGRYRIKYAVNPYHLQGPGTATEWGDERCLWHLPKNKLCPSLICRIWDLTN